MNAEYQGRRAVVLGLGLTGYTLARWLAKHGATVSVADTRPHPPNAERLARENPGIPLETGPFTASTFAGADVIAISPGVAKDQPAIADAVAAGADLVGDVELFARELPPAQKLLAITGTNGKTTTTALAGELARAAGLAATVAGNIGDAVLDALEPIEAGAPWPDVFVLELSSYQLETTSSLRPTAATVLNVTANHMDRYAGIADYAAAKARIFNNATVQVLNRDDPIVRLMRRKGETLQTFGASVPISEEEWGLVMRPDGEWLGYFGKGLVMRAIHAQLLSAHDLRQQRASLQLRIVDHGTLAVRATVIERTRYLRLDVHDERAAKRHVDQLMPAADGKERLALTKNFLHQHQFEQVSFRLRLGNRLPQRWAQLFGVKLRLQIVPAREHNAVGPRHGCCDQRLRGYRRRNPWQAASRGNRPRIFVRQAYGQVREFHAALLRAG